MQKLIKISQAELEASRVPAYTCGHISISASSAKQKTGVRIYARFLILEWEGVLVEFRKANQEVIMSNFTKS